MQGDGIFAQFLFDAGVLPRALLSDLLEESRRSEQSLAEMLVSRGVLSEEDTTRALGKALGIPFVSLSNDDIDDDALESIPEAFCRAHGLVAYKKDGGDLYVAALDLKNIDALSRLGIPQQVHIHLTDRPSLKRALLQYQHLLGKRYALRFSSQVPVEDAVDSLFLHAFSQGARAVHLEPSASGLSVRYRIDGALHPALMIPSEMTLGVVGRLKSLAKISGAFEGIPQDGRFAVEHAGARRAVHVVSLPTHAGESLVLTLAEAAALESLGLHGEGAEELYRALHARSGLVLVCGQAEPNFETLMHALAGAVSAPHKKVLQVEESGSVPLSVRLRAALRHDPDVLCVPLMSDEESATLAAHAANRGVLVIAGVYAEGVAGALELLQTFVPPDMLAAVFRAAVAVRSVAKLCSKHQRSRLPREEIDELEARGARLPAVLAALKAEGVLEADAQWKDVSFFAPVPCEACSDGYSGRLALFEVAGTSMLLANLLRQGAGRDELDALLREDMSLSLLEDGVYKAALGQTSVEEVLQGLV